MKKNLDFSQFFILPDAWDSVIPINNKNPIIEFNKLNMKTKFDESLDISSLNQFFQELIFYIKTENMHYVNNLVFGFIPILLNVTDESDNIIIDSAFYQISKLMFNNIYKRNQKYPSILIAVSLFDILSSNLPISISYGHLYHIQEEQAKLIHQYLNDGSNFSLPTKCLAVSLAFSSARFNPNNPNYPSYCQALQSVDPSRLQFLPDPLVMLENSQFFTPPELICASFCVQYSNSLVFSIGLDQLKSNTNRKSVLDLKRTCTFQILATCGDLTSGSLSHSIYVLGLQPSTYNVLHNFFRALDCACGVELTKEIFLINTTRSFAKMASSLGVSMLAAVFRSSEPSSPSLDVLLPFDMQHESLHCVISHMVEMTRNDEDRTSVLRFLGSLHSVLLRLVECELTSTYAAVVEHVVGLSFAAHAFVEMLTLQPQLERTEVTRLSVCVTALGFTAMNRFGVRSLSSKFVRGTFDAAMYLMHVMADSVSFVLFDVVRAYNAMRAFAASHSRSLRRFMTRGMPDVLIPAASVIVDCFDTKEMDDVRVLIRVVNYACRSYVPQFFYAARTSVLSFARDAHEDAYAAFSKQFFDLYFTIITPTHRRDSFVFNPDKIGAGCTDEDDLTHTQCLYMLLMADLLNSRETAIRHFTSHPSFAYFYADAQHAFDSARDPYTPLICPIVEIMSAVWKEKGAAIDAAGLVVRSEVTREVIVVGDDDLSDHVSTEKVEDNSVDFPSLSRLIDDVQFLWPKTASSVLSIALEVVRRHASLPYRINFDAVLASQAENAADFVREIGRILPGCAPEIASHTSDKTVKDHPIPGPPDCGLPWTCRYEFDFIVEQRPLIVSHRNVTLPNSQIIKEEEDEEEEEEEKNVDDSSEF